MRKPYDFLLVGAGLYSAVFAWRVAQCGKRCLVVERRKHTGGNVHCECIEGINVHSYGPHIFHTSDKEVWEMVNGIVPFNGFVNTPLARHGERLYDLPFNMHTFFQIWGCTTPAEATAILERQRGVELAAQLAQGHEDAQNLEEQALRLVGRDIYETLIKGYTEKQWGRPCTELPPSIIRRLPVRMTFDNNYFNDTYQGIPMGGYNRLIDGLLERADVRLGCDYLLHRAELRGLAERVVYTGSMDEYFDYSIGRLEYRSVRFETEVVPVPNVQGNAVINHTDIAVPYTRTVEHKHFEMHGDALYRSPVSVVSREYGVEWTPSAERSYPVNDWRNMALYRRYAEMGERERGVIFGGRLAEYSYFDMDDVVAGALRAAETALSGMEARGVGNP